MITVARVCMWLGAGIIVAGCGSDDPEPAKTTTCDPSKVQCGDKCVDLSSDPSYCGGCDQACDTAQVCSRGECRAACQSGLADCDGSCSKLLVDPDNCGTCGNACAQGLVCSAGTCATSCQAGLSICSGLCIDVTSDFDNCGACGKQCEAGQLCTKGACHVQCEQGLTECVGSCVNTGNDPLNCGECGNACGTGKKCSAGACVANCGPGLTDCSGSCRDITSDPANCLGCGNACAPIDNAAPVCLASGCSYVCNAGFADCNNSPADGCEAALDTSSHHCGACGHSCLGRTCQSGMCAVESVLPGITVSGSIESDGTYLFYSKDGGIYRQLIGGGSEFLLASETGTQAVSQMILSGDQLFFTELNTGAYVMPVTGSGVMPLAMGTGWDSFGIAVRDGFVYFTTRGDDSIRRVGLQGGNPEVLYTLAGSNPEYIVVDSNNIYWTESGTGSVMQAPKGGGTSLSLAQAGVNGIAVGPSHVYWSNSYEGKLYRTPIGGGASEVVATGASQQWGLAQDESAVYWTMSGKVVRISFAGGPPLVLATTVEALNMMTDGGWLYWINEKNDVRRVPK